MFLSLCKKNVTRRILSKLVKQTTPQTLFKQDMRCLPMCVTIIAGLLEAI